MHAFLIITKDETVRISEIKKIAGSFQAKINSFAADGIDDIKNISRFTRLKTTRPQVVLLERIDKSSIAAINALLKTLEEPQKNLYFILTASNYYAVPETIRSRCQISKFPDPSEIEQTDIDSVKEFINKSTSEKFLFFDQIKDRDQAINFINLIIRVIQKDLIISEKPEKYVRLLESAQLCLENLEANGNVNLQLTDFVVGIDNSK
jgi:DNA polymerase III delta prime subunit